MTKTVGEFSGLVVARYDYRESDLLVKILIDRFGKKMFLIHRARKPGFKLTAGILPFTFGNYVGTVNDDGLSYLTAIKSATQFRHIAEDITLNAYATYVLGLVDLAFRDGEPLGDWFDQAKQSLTLIDQGLDPAIIANIAEVQLLQAFGVQPSWHGCVIDQRTDLPLDFSEQYGGLLCQAHWHLDPYRYHATAKTIYLLQRFSTLNLKQLHTIKVGPVTKADLRRVLDRIYTDMVGVTPKAKRFLDQMQHWQDQLPPQSHQKEDPHA